MSADDEGESVVDVVDEIFVGGAVRNDVGVCVGRPRRCCAVNRSCRSHLHWERDTEGRAEVARAHSEKKNENEVRSCNLPIAHLLTRQNEMVTSRTW